MLAAFNNILYIVCTYAHHKRTYTKYIYVQTYIQYDQTENHTNVNEYAIVCVVRRNTVAVRESVVSVCCLRIVSFSRNRAAESHWRWRVARLYPNEIYCYYISSIELWR